MLSALMFVLNENALRLRDTKIHCTKRSTTFSDGILDECIPLCLNEL